MSETTHNANAFLSQFDYDLPGEFIAQTAVEPRDASRLLVVHRHNGQLEHRQFRDVIDYLRAGDMVVLNQTRVIPARLHARKIPGGGAAEILLIQPLTERQWLAMIGASRIKVGTRLRIYANEQAMSLTAEVVAVREDGKRVVEFSERIEPHLPAVGELPLPPYIHEKLTDPARYQTVYARKSGSIAAPTAGLHFTGELLNAIRDHGVEIAYCTLHVGPGTFQPVRREQIASHHLHEEFAELLPEEAKRINEAKLRGGRIIAVGTTTARTLETAALRSAGVTDLDTANEATVCPWRPVTAIAEPTSLFIMPGYQWRVVDRLVTNFHLPKSTLLMLVSAFAGRDLTMQVYETAKAEGYRFYSLGDASLWL